MATEIVGIRFNVTAQTAQAQAQINALATTVDRLETKLTAMGGPKSNHRFHQTAQMLNSMGDTRVDLRTPTQQMENLTEKIKKGKINLDEFRQSFRKNGDLMNQQLAQQHASLKNYGMGPGGRMQATLQYGDLTKAIPVVDQLTNRLRVQGESLKALGQHWIDAGKNAAFSARQLTISLTAPMALVAGYSIKTYKDIDKQLTDVAKLYDTNAKAHEESISQIKDDALDLAVTMNKIYGSKIPDSLKTMQFYAQQGQQGRQLESSVTQASRLSILGDVDIETSQQAIATLTHVLGVGADEMGRFVDYMNAFEDATTLGMQDIAEGLPVLSPVVKSFTKDADDIMVAVNSMLEVGKRGGIESAKETANAWKSIYTKMVRPTKQLQEQWERTGSQYGVHESFTSLIERHEGNIQTALEEIANITSTWENTDRQRLFAQLAGAYQVSRLSIFADVMTASNEYQDKVNEINETFLNNPQLQAENSKRILDAQKNSASVQWEQFIVKMQQVLFKIGEHTFEPILNILDKVTSAVGKIVDIVANMPQFLKDGAKFMALIAAFAGPAVGVFAAIKQLSGMLVKQWANGYKWMERTVKLGAKLSGINMAGLGRFETKEDTVARLETTPAGQASAQLTKMGVNAGADQKTVSANNAVANSFDLRAASAKKASVAEAEARLKSYNALVRESAKIEKVHQKRAQLIENIEGKSAKDRERFERKLAAYRQGRKEITSRDPHEKARADRAYLSMQRKMGMSGAPASGSVANQLGPKEALVIREAAREVSKLNLELDRLNAKKLDTSKITNASQRAGTFAALHSEALDVQKKISDAEAKARAARLKMGAGNTATTIDGTGKANTLQQSMSAHFDQNNQQIASYRAQIERLDKEMALPRTNSSNSLKKYQEMGQERARIATRMNEYETTQASIIASRGKMEQAMIAQRNAELNVSNTKNSASEKERESAAKRLAAAKREVTNVEREQLALVNKLAVADEKRAGASYKDRITTPPPRLKPKDPFAPIAPAKFDQKAMSNMYSSKEYKQLRKAMKREDTIRMTTENTGTGITSGGREYNEQARFANLSNGKKIKMTPELERGMAQTVERTQKRAEKLSNTHDKINEKAKTYANSLTMAGGAAATMAALFGNGGPISTGIASAGTALAVLGQFDFFEKFVANIAKQGATMFSSLSTVAGEFLGTKVGGRFGDQFGTAFSTKASGALTFLKNNMLKIGLWGAAAGAAIGGAAAIWKAIRKDSEEYIESLKRANATAEKHAEIIGYNYSSLGSQTEGVRGLSETLQNAAEAYKNDENFTDILNGMSANLASTDLEALELTLREESIKILGTGGGIADVQAMVGSLLAAAGADTATIEEFTLKFGSFKIEADTFDRDLETRKLADRLMGEGSSITAGDQFESHMPWTDEFDAAGGWSGWNSGGFIGTNETWIPPSAIEGFKKDVQQFTAAYTMATEEEKPKIAKAITDLLAEQEKAAKEAGGRTEELFNERKRFVLETIYAESADLLAQVSDSEALQTNLDVLIAVTAEDDAETTIGEMIGMVDSLKKSVEETSGRKLEPVEERTLYNLLATKHGFEQLNKEGTNMWVKIADVQEKVRKSSGDLIRELQNSNTLKIVDPEAGPTADQINRIDRFNDILNKVPNSFTRHYRFEVTDAVEDMEKVKNMMNEGGQRAVQKVESEAMRLADEGHQNHMESIRQAGENNLKALENQEKASSKAWEQASKALDAKFKSQTKTLDSEQKEAKKVFDKTQKEEKKAFDKTQKEEKKAFDKKTKEEKKVFDKEQKLKQKAYDDDWKGRREAVESYYDGVKKAIEDQGKAEDRLDQLRQRNAEREERRRKALAELNNNNIDINVAMAGGDLDEVARLTNNAATVATDYLAESAEAESGYAKEDEDAAREKRLESLDKGREAGLSAFDKQKELADEVQQAKMEAEAEAYEERKALEAERFEEEKALEAERFEEKKSLEAERFAEEQALEKERLQLAQEAERERMEAQKAAEAEQYAQRKQMLQDMQASQEKSAQANYDANKRAIEGIMEEWRQQIPATQAEAEEMTQTMIDSMKAYGIDLSDHGDYLKDKSVESFVEGINIAAAKTANETRWAEVGEDISGIIKKALSEGLSTNPGDIIKAMFLGTPIPGVPTRDLPSLPSPTAKATTPMPLGGDWDRYRANTLPPMQGLLPGKATGGAISGPGTGTSDSILARLSNGEHVLTAREVAKMGGHAAVEKLRKAILSGKLPAFAKGGSVGTGVRSSSAGAGKGSGVSASVSISSVGDDALSSVEAGAQAVGAAFDSGINQTAAPAWQLLGDTMVAVKDGSIDPVMDSIKTHLAELAAQTTNSVHGQMNPAWQQFGSNLQTVKQVFWDTAMTGFKGSLNELQSGIANAITQHMIPRFTDGAQHVKTMQDTVLDPTLRETRDATTQTAQNFGTAADMIGEGWGRVKENSAAPVRYTIDTVFNKGLVGMWNEVATALDLEPFKAFPLSFATGGVLPGYTPGKDVHDFVSPTGGRLRLSGGEAIMRPEWTKAVGGPTAVEAMNATARSGGVSAVKKQLGEGAQFATGGVLAFANGGTVDEKIDRTMARAKQEDGKPYQWGGVGNPSWDCSGLWSGIVSHLNGGPFGGRLFTTHPFEAGNPPAGFVPGLSGPVTVGVGPGHMAGTLAGVNMESASMPKGVHIGRQAWGSDHSYFNRQFTLREFTGKFKSGGLGGSGAMTVDPAMQAAYDKWTEGRDILKEQITSFIAGGPDTHMKAIPGKVYTGISDAMESKIIAAIPGLGGVSLGEYGENAEFFVREIIEAAKERNLDKKAAKIAIATALVESELKMHANHAVPESLGFKHDAIGSDHDSVGLFQQRNNGAWGTTAQRMNPRASAGMFYNALMRIPNWAGMDEGAVAQAVQGSAFPEKYAPRMGEAQAWIDRVGWNSNVESGAPGENRQITRAGRGSGPDSWFDRGGEASGVGFMEKNTLEPERVLSPQQTKSFARMVPIMSSLDRSFSNARNAVAPAVKSAAMEEADYMRKLSMLPDQLKMEEREPSIFDTSKMKGFLEPIMDFAFGQIRSAVVPAVVGYATDLIKLDSDAARVDKIASDIIGGIKNIPGIAGEHDFTFNFNGAIYGVDQLNDILNKWKQDVIREIEVRNAMAQQVLGGK